MSQFSRVNKNKDLYQSIIEDDKTEVVENSLRDFESRTSRTTEEKTVYNANRLKHKDEYINLATGEMVQEEQLTPFEKYDLEVSSIDHSYQNEANNVITNKDLLSEFIEEVKHYNINRGLRSDQDTQTNILNNLNHQNLSEPSVVVELTNEIQQIIGDLEEETKKITLPQSEEVVIDSFKPLDEQQNRVLSEMLDEIETSAINVVNVEDYENKSENVLKDEVREFTREELLTQTNSFEANELFELTQSLNLKLEEQKNELEKVKKHSTFIDRLVTGIFILLIFSLVVLIGYAFWFIMKERGY